MRRCRVPVPAVTVIIAASLGCIFPPRFFGLRGLLVHIPGVTGFGMATMARQISGGNSQRSFSSSPKEDSQILIFNAPAGALISPHDR